MTKYSLSLERLKYLLRYDADVGLFYWIAKPIRGPATIGAIAGYPSPKNGWVMRIDGEQYYGHRLAWFYMTGSWPTNQLDHKNTDRLDNRWSNLREATHLTNNRNVGLKSHNTSGAKGVSFCKVNRRYYTYINADKRRHFLGYYDTVEEAARVYDAAAIKHHGAFARLNFPERA